MGFSDALNNFDSAPDPDDGLAAFDAADGKTHIPAGWYVCAVHRGELTKTKAGKPCYRLALDVSQGVHVGYRLWRYYMLDTYALANKAKAALAPLGLLAGPDLKQPYPPFGKVVRLHVLVGVQDRPGYGLSNDVERFELIDITDSPTDPDAIDPTAFGDKGEGGSR